MVPEPSERRTTVIFSSGSFTPPFSATMRGSFHLVILPRKMSASSGPSNFSAPEATPGTFITGTTPPMTDGNWARPDLARSAGVSGASDEPKSTSAARIFAMPPPEPIDW